MALLDFPSGPSLGQSTTQNGNTWKWNGTSWVAFNNVSLTSQVTGILAVDYGGTGFGGTYTAGDILYALSSNTFGKLNAGTAGSVLASGGPSTAPYWKKDDAGTGSVSAGTLGGFAYYDTTNSITSGTAVSYIIGSGAGGTGATFVIKQSTMALIGSTITAGTWAGSAITAKYGGTGLNALSAGDIIYGSATDTYSRLSHPGAGYALTSVGSTVAWVTISTLNVGNSTTSGTATSAIRSGVVDLVSVPAGTLYLTGNTASTGANSQTLYTSGTGVTFDSNSVTATTFRGNATSATSATTAGTATSAIRAGVLDLVSVPAGTLYFTGNTVSTGTNSVTQYTSGTGVTFDSNSITATTFRGNATTAGTATSAIRAGVIDLVSVPAGTLYLTGNTVSTGTNSTTQYTSGTGVTFDSNSITATTFRGNATSATSATTAGTATSAIRAGVVDLVSVPAGTLYLTGNTVSTGTNSTTQYTSGTGVTFDSNSITATTFRGNATSATKATNISGGAAGAGQSLHIQTALDTTSFLNTPSTTGLALTTTGSGNLAFGSLSNLAVTSLSQGTGINVSASIGSVTVTNIGVTSITGTTNRVTVSGSGSGGTGAVTLTTPQDIHTSASPTFADIALNGGSSTLTTVGSNPTSMVNKQYVDNLASGLDIHGSVRVVQTSAIGASYVQSGAAGTSAIGAFLISTTQVALPAIDGITISATGASQRVLIAGGATGRTNINGSGFLQTPVNSALVNGIYYVGALGGAGTSNWILVRATDTDDSVELTAGTFCFVEEGTLYKDTGWACTNDTTNYGPIQFGLDNANTGAINFSQFTGAAAISFGQGITRVGNTVASNVNLSSTGVAAAIGYTQFNIGGPSVGGAADTGYYPTFSVRTSGNVIAGSALLTLNSDGFSLIGSTSTNRTLNLNGGSLTVTGDISIPTPGGIGRIPYSGTDSTTLSFLSHPGAGYALTSVGTGTSVAWQLISSLSAGLASTSTRSNTFDVTGVSGTTTYYLVGTTSSSSTSGVTPYTSGTGVSFDSTSVTATTFRGNATSATSATTAGTATSAIRAGVIDLVSVPAGTLYLTGNTVSTGTNSTTQYTSGSGVTFDSNSITATTFRGNATSATSATTAGTATSAIRAGVLDLVSVPAGTLYFTGTTSSSGSNSQTQYTSGTGLTFDSSSITATTFRGNATTAGTATSAVRAGVIDLVSVPAGTLYLTGNTVSTGTNSATQYTSGSGVTFDSNSVTATTFRGNATSATSATTAGTATSAIRAGVVDLVSVPAGTLYLTGNTVSTGTNSTTQYTSGSGVTFDSNSITATTFRGNATSATNSTNVNVTAASGSGNSYLAFVSGTSGNLPILIDSNITVDAATNTITATNFSGIASSATRVGITTSVSTSDLPIVFADAHQPYAALGSSTLLTYQASTGKITNGIWAGTAITTGRGGTGLITVSPNQILMGASTGNTWAAVGSSVVPVVAIGAAAPAQPGGAIGATQAGQLWWDSEYGVLKVY